MGGFATRANCLSLARSGESHGASFQHVFQAVSGQGLRQGHQGLQKFRERQAL